MVITEKIFVVLGVVSFLFSGMILMLRWNVDHSSGWANGIADPILLIGSAAFAVIGLCLLLFGLHQLKQARETREFEKALEKANAPRKGK
jgi:phosphotransferase system  glucose/maltose/N-acetylglucosamine-specific IIC component